MSLMMLSSIHLYVTCIPRIHLMWCIYVYVPLGPFASIYYLYLFHPMCIYLNFYIISLDSYVLSIFRDASNFIYWMHPYLILLLYFYPFEVMHLCMCIHWMHLYSILFFCFYPFNVVHQYMCHLSVARVITLDTLFLPILSDVSVYMFLYILGKST